MVRIVFNVLRIKNLQEMSFDVQRFYTLKKQVRKKFDAYKYCVTISLAIDSLQIQKQMRDEWE